MSSQRPSSHGWLDLLALGLSPEALLQAAHDFSEATGIRLSFQQGSNPQFHIHIHGEIMTKKSETSAQYTDQSTGPTGAKAFGPQSSAVNYGDVAQKNTLESEQSAELVKAFDQLVVLLIDTQLADRAKLDETLDAIKQAKANASSDQPQKSVISSAWEKAKGWVTAALSVGTFVATKAEEVRALITKITGLLS
jgi:hypothetical protein